MDIHRWFLILYVHLKCHFAERQWAYDQAMGWFDDWLKFVSYNLFNRRIFYFIALCSKASLTLFFLRLIFRPTLRLWFRAAMWSKIC